MNVVVAVVRVSKRSNELPDALRRCTATVLYAVHQTVASDQTASVLAFNKLSSNDRINRIRRGMSFAGRYSNADR